MSKNIVDTIIEISNTYKIPFTFIPSRRQIEHDGGYVNNWTTAEFAAYVYQHSQYIAIQRDHGGPNQGGESDDGYVSLAHDCRHLDSIHIDPWKQYNTLVDGIQWTVDMLRFCYSKNDKIYFEIGTEESIRKFELHELDHFLHSLKTQLDPAIFERILFCVIQSGTGLQSGKNTGVFDNTRLQAMLEILAKYGLASKEHNGDFLGKNEIAARFEMGLTSINIAPELGIYETKIFLRILESCSPAHFETLYNLCHLSAKWKKWVDADFDPESNKQLLVELSLHYLFSDPRFMDLKTELDIQDVAIKRELYSYLDCHYMDLLQQLS